jgi:sulfhydrogenase subunit beta (sulfur reductase)
MAETYILKQASLEKLYESFKAQGNVVYAPFNNGKKIEFAKIDRFNDIVFDYINSNQSTKEIVFPRYEKVFRYSTTPEDEIVLEDYKPESLPNTVIFGQRPCDATGILALKAIFQTDYNDSLFSTKYDKVSFITISCIKSDENCFCTSSGFTPGSTEGSDILLTPIESGDYYAEVMTEKGKLIVETNKAVFEPSEQIDKLKYLAKVEVKFENTNITTKLSGKFEHETWVEQSLRCIGCGACAYVCPACACFDIQDENNGKKGFRYKCWDSCGFGLFTLHTSGHNPREVQSQRWRQRIYHKFSYMIDREKVFGCVGCGRCSRVCPVNMNLIEHLQTINEL